ncbi:MAG: OmpH family outer membrane protein [Bacteroidota bacterium]|nr:OmpH family outer membrane protein [Bacteroidota bacterium]
MNKIIKFGLILSVVLFSGSLFSQTKVKLGHIDSNVLLQSMPGRDSVKSKLEKHAKSLESQLKTMSSEFESKYQDFQSNQSTMTDLIKQTKQKELEELQQRIQSFQQQAEDDLKKNESKLLTPIINKAKKAIEEVGKENGYTYIFDSSVGVLLYFDQGDDVMPLVKKKLGIK